MVKKTMYDPWQSITTRNGYCCDEVISALQKSIRRANEEDACKFAYELYITSPELEEKMWRRLLTIINYFGRRYWNGKSDGGSCSEQSVPNEKRI